MRKTLKILTPENVYVEYELAGLGSRFIAIFLDTIAQLVLCAIVLIGMLIGGVDFSNIGQFNSIVIALGIALLFIVWSGYFIFFEMVLNGQSPGKKIARLRVIKQTGDPINFFDSFLRNILRIADFLPSLYLVGSVFILFNGSYKRVGDLAANIIVVKVKKDEQPLMLDVLMNRNTLRDEDEETVKIYPVNHFEYGILKEFLSRKGSLGARKPVFIYHLNRYFMKKFNIEKSYDDPIVFFEEILKLNS